MKIDNQTLVNLPEHGILSYVTKVECEVNADENEDIGIDTGPVNDVEDDERVYNSEIEMNSFVPRRNTKLSFNWNVGDEPLSEFNCQFLVSMAFPTFISRSKR